MKNHALQTAPSLLIRDIEPADIETVRALAHRIWHAYYVPAIVPLAQVEYMLKLMYSPESLKKQLAAGHRFWLIKTGRTLAGFASVEEKSGGHWHMHKLYVDTATHGQGLGSALMEHIVKTINPREMTLGVNRQNIQAINFYLRHGFRITELRDTDIGGGFTMFDFIMKRSA